jgi:hypothetical protein
MAPDVPGRPDAGFARVYQQQRSGKDAAQEGGDVTVTYHSSEAEANGVVSAISAKRNSEGTAALSEENRWVNAQIEVSGGVFL